MSHRTQFAGLSAPDVGESPTQVQNGDFVYRNPDLIDQFLRIGAVTHRHDGHAALLSPSRPLTLALGSGGQLDADTTYWMTYTTVDGVGGETTAATPASAHTSSSIPDPTIAPSAGVSYASGIMPAGNYAYALTYTDGQGGETLLGPITWVYVAPGFASAQVILTNLDLELTTHGGQAVDYRLWRSYEGNDWHLVTELAGTTFVDDGFDPPDNPARPPGTNTTRGVNQRIFYTFPSIAQEPSLGSACAVRVYIALDNTFASPALASAFGAGASVASKTYEIDVFAPTTGQPPSVSLSLPGANQINPDTDLVDWHWKRPVALISQLPTSGNASADARMVLNPLSIFGYTGTKWQPVAVASAIGAAGGVFLGGSAGVNPAPFGLETYIEFTGSGGTGVAVQNFGSGSARVIISAPSAGTGGTAGIGGLFLGGSAGANPAPFGLETYIEFTGSGGTGVAVQNLGGGSARILVSASGLAGPQGPQGPPGTSGGGGVGGIYLAGSAGVNPAPFGAETYVEFAGSGGTNVAVQNLTGGSARVLISASGGQSSQGPAGPQGPAGSAIVLGPTLRFNDDFSTNDIGNWTITSGSPSITGGLFTSDGGDDRAQLASAAGGLYSQQRVQAKFVGGSDFAVMAKVAGGGSLWAQYNGGTFAIKDFITGAGLVTGVSYTPPSTCWIRLTFTVSTVSGGLAVSGLAVAEIFTSDPNAPGATPAQTLVWSTNTSSIINSTGTVGWRVNGAGSVDDFYYWSMNTPQPNVITAHASGQNPLGGYTDLAFAASAASQPPQVAVSSLGGGSALVLVGVSSLASAWSDDFSANDISAYGSNGTLAISGGVLTPTDTSLKVPYASGTVLTDFVSTVKVTPGASVSSSGQDISLTGRFKDSQNYIFGQAFAGNGTTDIQIFAKTIIANAITTLNSVTVTGLKWQQSVPYWLRFVNRGGYLRIEIWTQDPVTAPAGSVPFAQTEGMLTSSQIGSLPPGPAGLRWTPDSTSATLDDFRVDKLRLL